MAVNYKRRKISGLLSILAVGLILLVSAGPSFLSELSGLWSEFAQYDLNISGATSPDENSLATLDTLAVKGRAPKTGYKRELFANSWQSLGKCSMRNLILKRDLNDVVLDEECRVLSGSLNDLYSGKTIEFTYGPATSNAIQIDHIVAVSDAWQKGAQSWDSAKRYQFYNDPENLVAVSGEANQQKSDSDASSWLPSNKSFRCDYVARQIQIKAKYGLWVTEAEKQAMKSVLQRCSTK